MSADATSGGNRLLTDGGEVTADDYVFAVYRARAKRTEFATAPDGTITDYNSWSRRARLTATAVPRRHGRRFDPTVVDTDHAQWDVTSKA